MPTKVLVIDADAARLDAAVRAFTAAGLDASGCARAGDAAATAREADAALVVISDDLPDRAAVDLLVQLRDDKATRNATYLVLTDGNPRTVAEAMAEHGAKAQDFAPRSLPPDALVQRSLRLLASQGVSVSRTGEAACPAASPGGGFSIGMSGNLDGAAKPAVVATSDPSAQTAPADPLAALGRAGRGAAPAPGASAGAGARKGEKVAVQYNVTPQGGGPRGQITPDAAVSFAVEAPRPAELAAAKAPARRSVDEAVAALNEQAARAADPAEKVRALEQLMALYYDELENVAETVRAAEKIVALDPGHAAAVTFLREVYRELGAKDRLAAVEEGFRRAVTGR